jgi:zinc protease
MHHTIAATMLVAVVALGAVSTPAQQPQQQQQRPESKGAVIKGKAPVNKEILKVTLPKPYETKLTNGMQVLILENHRLPTFSMQMVFLSGGLADPAGNEGSAQYVANMLREGTKTRNSRDIAEQVDRLGASLGANSSLTSFTSVVNASGLIENYDQILELFADVILNPSFPADELKKLKDRNTSQIRLQRSNPGFLSAEMFARAIYGKHPGGRFALNADQIQRFTPEILAKFHSTFYKPNNAIFAIVGDVNRSAIIASLEKTFASWKRGDIPKTDIPKVEPTGPSKIYLINRPNSVQTNLVVGTQSIERTNPDYFALEVMNQVLGGGGSARLFLNLREDKGYTYGAYSNVSSFKYPGSFRANTEVRTDVTKGSMDELMYELKRVRNEKVPTEEVEAAKRAIVGGWALQLESPQSLLQNAIQQKIYGLPADYWDTYPQKISSVTSEEAQRVAQKYINLDKLQIIAVGDASKISDVLKGFGPLEVLDTELRPLTSTQPASTEVRRQDR